MTQDKDQKYHTQKPRAVKITHQRYSRHITVWRSDCPYTWGQTIQHRTCGTCKTRTCTDTSAISAVPRGDDKHHTVSNHFFLKPLVGLLLFSINGELVAVISVTPSFVVQPVTPQTQKCHSLWQINTRQRGLVVQVGQWMELVDIPDSVNWLVIVFAVRQGDRR